LKIVDWWRLQIWLKNVPHTGLVSYKKDQNWVKQEEYKFIFPGGGTQFKIGALHYIEFIQEVWDLFFFIPAIVPLSCCSPYFSFIKFC
jgi:hypothetical protein